MKIKALAKCAKDDGLITLLDEVHEGIVVRQFVMLPGRAIYPLDGLPKVNEETLLAIMDIAMDKRDGYQVTRLQMNDRLLAMVEDAKASDVEAEYGSVIIQMAGNTMMPIIGAADDHAYFVEMELMQVLSDLRGLKIVERMVDGSRVFVVQNGMLTVACLLPNHEFWSEKGAEHLMKCGFIANRVYNCWEQEHVDA